MGLAIAFTAVQLMRDALQVMLDAVPPHIQVGQVRDVLQALPGVVDVHHVHIWCPSTTQVALTAHLRRTSDPALDLDLLHRAKDALREVGVDHATLQLEPGGPGGSPAAG